MVGSRIKLHPESSCWRLSGWASPHVLQLLWAHGRFLSCAHHLELGSCGKKWDKKIDDPMVFFCFLPALSLLFISSLKSGWFHRKFHELRGLVKVLQSQTFIVCEVEEGSGQPREPHGASGRRKKRFGKVRNLGIVMYNIYIYIHTLLSYTCRYNK